MIRLFRQYFSIRKMAFVIGEGLLIFLAVTLASYWVYGRELGIVNMLEMIWFKVLVVALVTQIVLYHNDLYEMDAITGVIDLVYRLIQAIGITSIILAVIYLLRPDMIIARWVFFVNLIFLLLFLVCWRLIYALILKKKLFAEKACIVGSGELAENILNEINAKKDLSYYVPIIIAPEAEQDIKIQSRGIPVYHGSEDICDLAERHNVGHIIVALDEKRGIFPYQQLLACKIRGINIIDGESFYERISGKLLVEKITPGWLIFSEGFVKNKTTKFTKRLVGLLISTLLLIIFFPLILITAIAIKLDSRGPVFFLQRRVGENEILFDLYKFRSMMENAEKETGPIWAEKDDPRVTRIGAIIRKFRIDELPQLWNVFKGDMSFVGPRPERPFFVEKLKKTVPYYKERSSIKPGITGWAQVNYPYGSSEADAVEKLKLDLFYVKNMSIAIDLMIIFKTIKIVLLGKGSR